MLEVASNSMTAAIEAVYLEAEYIEKGTRLVRIADVGLTVDVTAVCARWMFGRDIIKRAMDAEADVVAGPLDIFLINNMALSCLKPEVLAIDIMDPKESWLVSFSVEGIADPKLVAYLIGKLGFTVPISVKKERLPCAV